jgi:undecaprenyl diphosphate synthase
LTNWFLQKKKKSWKFNSLHSFDKAFCNMSLPAEMPVPHHVAIIMDGNGRWAQKRGQPRTFGHRKGVDAIERTLKASQEIGIKCLTLFAFSTENWKRPADEVHDLMHLMRFYLQNKLNELDAHKIRLRIIGDKSAFPHDLKQLFEEAEVKTQDHTDFTLQIAVSYSGRWDMRQAMIKLAQQVKEGSLDPQTITDEMISASLQTSTVPEPDLLIRTSGEQRISNFMLWQMAYSELYFTETLWPDFDKSDLVHAVQAYQSRERRFGGLSASSDKNISETR